MYSPISIQYSLTNSFAVPGSLGNTVKPAASFIPLTWNGAEESILVEVDGVISTDWTYQAATNTITFTGEFDVNSLPVNLTVERQTIEDSNADYPQEFKAGSAIRAEDLNLMLAKIKELETN